MAAAQRFLCASACVCCVLFFAGDKMRPAVRESAREGEWVVGGRAEWRTYSGNIRWQIQMGNEADFYRPTTTRSSASSARWQRGGPVVHT